MPTIDNPVPRPRRAVALAALLAVIVPAAIWASLLQPAAGRLTDAEAATDASTLRANQIRAELTAVAGGADSPVVAALEQARQADLLLPDDLDAVQSAITIQDLIASAGLAFSSLVPGEAVVDGDLHHLPFAVSLDGTPGQLRAFAGLLALQQPVMTVDAIPYSDDATQQVTTTVRVWATSQATIDAKLEDSTQTATPAGPPTDAPTAEPSEAPGG